MTIHPIDTVSLITNGKNGSEFDLNPERFKKRLNENDEVWEYQNTFYDEEGKRSIHVKNDLNYNYTVVTFSAPKLIYGNSLENFNLEDSNKLIETINSRLDGIMEADFSNWNLSRLDVTQNIYVEHPVSRYIQSLNEAYVHNRRYKPEKFGNESIVIKNKSRRYTAYDKVQEVIDKKELKPKEAKLYGNILRFEAQHKKGQHIRNAFKREFTLSDILTEDFTQKGRLYLLQEFDRFFCNSGKLELFENDLAAMDLISKYSKRNQLKNWLIHKLTNDYKIEHDYVYYDHVLESTMSAKGRKKAIKEIRELLSLRNKHVSDFIEEIRSKLVA